MTVAESAIRLSERRSKRMAEDKKGGKKGQPRQKQTRGRGLESQMRPRPVADDPKYKAAGKLDGKIALITGGDSGIGRAVAILFAHEGADIAIVYLNEHKDAKETVRLVEHEGRRCIAIAGDVGQEKFCQQAVKRVVKELGGLDILVN